MIALAAAFSVMFSSCSSTPIVESDPPVAPSWTTQPRRLATDGKIAMIGYGEDRYRDRAVSKAESMALQDIANECSVVPEGTQITSHYSKLGKDVYRSYALLQVSINECRDDKDTEDGPAIRHASNTDLTRQLADYQKNVDIPEPEEAKALTGGVVIKDVAQLYVIRQQLALAKQKAVFFPKQSLDPLIRVANRAISNFEDLHAEVWVLKKSFSAFRPNAAEHRASALRDKPAPTDSPINSED